MSTEGHKFRVAEIFGPTIQGEGRHVGVPCYFVRFGGCDYRCAWCDSPHAVLPDLVAALPQKTENEIIEALESLPQGPRWVVYSGGNPALLDLTILTAQLQGKGYSIMVETQGTVWKDWLELVDEVCISPKPPSSTNVTGFVDIYEFLRHSMARPYLKVVVFDDVDYIYAKSVHQEFPEWEMFLSAGHEDPTLPTVAHPDRRVSKWKDSAQLSVLDKMTWLMEKTASDAAMRDVRVLPQMHILAWGNVRGK